MNLRDLSRSRAALLAFIVFVVWMSPAGAQAPESVDEVAAVETAAPVIDAAQEPAAPAVPEESEEEELSRRDRLLYFLGRFHPMVLHFPIGLLAALVLLEIVTLGAKGSSNGAKWLLLVLGAGSAVVAAVFGLFLSWSSSYDEDLVFWHQWTGIAVAAFAVSALGFRIAFAGTKEKPYNWGYRASLLLSAFVLIPAGHYGAGLTHGTTYLTKYLPAELAFLEPVLGEGREVRLASLDDNYFNSEILPIFEAACFECHSAEKQKGEYRMDTMEFAMTTGETGKPPIVKGNALGSYLVELILLPEEDERVMPPKGKPPLTADEKVKIIEWVNRGAPWGDYTPPEATLVAGADILVDPDALEIVPVVKMNEIMTLFFESRFEELKENLIEEPKRRAAMKAVYDATYALAEAHNLLFSRTEEDYMETDEWLTMAVQGRIATNTLGEALKSRDYPGMLDAMVTLTKTCNVCHQEFSPDVDPVEFELPGATVDEAAEDAQSKGE